ncbi:MAG TPA: DnaJ domain-containing protein [Streptosporangiaceae bacterium]|nr:DnaJ domain-containing protein [Streptosporangiaceae bacterium]
MADAFSLLGISPEDQLTDDEVRAAWRRIAAATHPDRADGGDPERFAAAAAAYTELRTSYGRNEARAALAEPAPGAGRQPGRRPSRAQPPRAQPPRPATVARLRARVRGGRPARLALRVAVAAVAATLGVLAAGGEPAGPALAVGAATWLLLTARQDLGPPSAG